MYFLLVSVRFEGLPQISLLGFVVNGIRSKPEPFFDEIIRIPRVIVISYFIVIRVPGYLVGCY